MWGTCREFKDHYSQTLGAYRKIIYTLHKNANIELKKEKQRVDTVDG